MAIHINDNFMAAEIDGAVVAAATRWMRFQKQRVLSVMTDL
jgi:hypothetical protein